MMSYSAFGFGGGYTFAFLPFFASLGLTV